MLCKSVFFSSKTPIPIKFISEHLRPTVSFQKDMAKNVYDLCDGMTQMT